MRDGSEVLSDKREYNTRGQMLRHTLGDPQSGLARSTATAYCEQPDIDAGTCPLLGQVTKIDGPRTDVADLSSYTYYPADHATCATAPTTCAYRKGDLWKIANALGQTTEALRYDGAGRVLSMKDANGVITDLEYHPRGWLTARKVRGTNAASEADDLITRIDYSPTGLVEKTTLPDGSFTRFIYDAAHRLTTIEDAEGNRIRYTLDNAGNRIKEETLGRDGGVTRMLSRVYDELGQLEILRDAYDKPSYFTYDAGGNTDEASDALGRTTDNDYDPLGRLKQVIQDKSGFIPGVNAKTQFAYDALDNLIEVVDPNTLSTHYRYDGLGNLLRLESPDTGNTTFAYDTAGNRTAQTDARGVTTAYSYDALNRLVGVTYPTSSLDTDLTYDTTQPACVSGEQHSIGRLARITDGSGSTQYCYDRFGHLVRKVQSTSGQTFTLRYAYSGAGQLKAITYPDGTVVDYRRDTLGRATEVGVALPGQARMVLLREANYYPFGPVAEWVYGNGRLFQRTLNKNYQPGVIEDGFPGGLSLGFQFDDVGNLAKLRDGKQSDPALRNYSYDGLNRLTDVIEPDPEWPLRHNNYGYDKTGNRLFSSSGLFIDEYTYQQDTHRLIDVGGVARNYDPAGSVTSIGGSEREFSYNAAGRLSQVQRDNAVAMNYAYNGKGELVRRYLSSSNAYFLYDEAGQWLGQYDNAGAAAQQIVWLDNLPIGVIASGKLHYIEADHLGTPRVVIDPQRDKTVWRWDLTGEAFGNTAPNQDPDGDGTAFVLDMRFPGQRYEAAMGMNYNYFRDYDPATGRYVESDPIGLGGGTSTYGYVSAAPLTMIDPLGLQRAVPRPTPGGPYPGTGDDALYNWGPTAGEAMQGLVQLMSELVGNRPRGMTPAQESIYDRHCKSADDKCAALKAVIQSRVRDARTKMGNMFFDKVLYENAFRTPNPAATGGHNSSWLGHVDDLTNRIAQIHSMIALGKLMGCDMSQEERQVRYLFIPRAPFGY